MSELLSIEKINEVLSLGEDSFFQFKQSIEKAKDLAEEFVAFSNAEGGYIIVGVNDKDNAILGLTSNEIHIVNQLVSNTASENCIPNMHPKTENKTIEGKNIVIIYIPKGTDKPYQTKGGKYLTKSGADKRILSKEELARMFQENSHYHIEETAVPNTSIENDFDKGLFYNYFEQQEKISVIDFLEKNNMSLAQLLQNKNLAVGNQLSLLGLLYFAKNLQVYKPLFSVDAVSFYGNEVSHTNYKSKDNFTGTLDIQFRLSLNFIKNNLNKINKGNGFNNNSELEVNEDAIEEALINALIHRNYNINSTIKVFIFENRVEIISPGKLPNSLDEDKIKFNNPIARNPLISKYGREILPFSGLGTGVPRIIRFQPNTILVNDKEAEKFTITFPRINQ